MPSRPKAAFFAPFCSTNAGKTAKNYAKNSVIVKAQKESYRNVINGEEINEETKQQMIAYFGGDATPYMLMIYPKDFDTKEQVLAYLDAYNSDKESDDMVLYTDLAGTMSDMTDGIINGILIVLICFAMLSLVVSVIMICIITYTSVLERTKEIGVLRALGARKKDITRVFVAETFLLGIFTGALGIAITYGLLPAVNAILFALTELEGIAILNPLYAVGLVAISTLMTMLGGFIPAIIAAKKDAVVALRAE